MNRDDRVKIVWVSMRDLVNLITGKLRITNLPPDAICRHAEYRIEMLGFGVDVSSATFDEVPPGDLIPSFCAEYENVLPSSPQPLSDIDERPWEPAIVQRRAEDA